MKIRVCECGHLDTSHPRSRCVVDGCACGTFSGDPTAANPGRPDTFAIAVPVDEHLRRALGFMGIS